MTINQNVGTTTKSMSERKKRILERMAISNEIFLLLAILAPLVCIFIFAAGFIVGLIVGIGPMP